MRITVLALNLLALLWGMLSGGYGILGFLANVATIFYVVFKALEIL